MDQILAQNSQNPLDRYEGNFGDTMDGIFSGLQNVNNALGGNAGSKDFGAIVKLIINSILNPVVALLIGFAVVYFMWGLIVYVRRGGEEGDRTKGIQMMSYGIFALFVMVSVWGLVNILINTFGLSSSVPALPELQ
jgi:hypothetical protein